jgi:hypothetical protein
MTQFVSGKTSEPLFSVPGVAVALDPSGRFALVEMRNDLHAFGADFESARAAPARLRLVELSALDSFANEGRRPEGQRNDCEMGGQVALRTLSDRRDRLWNAYDWRRSSKVRPQTGTVGLSPDEEPAPKFGLKWKAGTVQLLKSEASRDAVLGSGSAEQISRMIPDWAALMVPGTDMQISELTSADGRYAAVRRRLLTDKEQLDWTLYRIEAGERQLIKRGRVSEREGNPVRRGIFFLDELSVVAVQEDVCSVTILQLPDGNVLGKLRAGYDQIDNVVRLADDLIAVLSSSRRDARQSIQIFDFPDLNPGPWLLTGDLGEAEPDSPANQPLSQPAAALPAATPTRRLVPFNWVDAEIDGDGRTLFLGQKRGNQLSDWIALSIPPWGERLRRLMLAP